MARPLRNPDPVQEVERLFTERGDSEYGGEAVTQLEHALQAAWLAEQSGASAALIVAALLHDVGHLLHRLPEDAPDHGIDDRHEELAARWLERRFGREVVHPVQQHVAAKRYLCATEAEYAAQLSPPSRQSLALQGGPMTSAEVEEFARQTGWEAALQVRRWDDLAKIPHLETPPLQHFLAFVEQVAARGPAGPA